MPQRINPGLGDRNLPARQTGDEPGQSVQLQYLPAGLLGERFHSGLVVLRDVTRTGLGFRVDDPQNALQKGVAPANLCRALARGAGLIG